MLNSISWQQYVTTLIVATILYYLFIWIVWYKAKVPLLSSIGRLQTPSFYDQGDDSQEIAKYIMEEVRTVFGGKTNKAEIILGLQQKLRKYSDHTDIQFRQAVNQYIADECESICSIPLGESDLRAVWS